MIVFGYSTLFLLGFVFVIFGGNIFVDSSIVIAKKTKMPTILIGATIVAMATTLPELIVSLISANQGNYGLAVGNVLGSVVSNTALVCGISICALPVVLDEKSSPIKFIFLVCTCIIFALFSLDLTISLAEGLTLLLVFILFMTLNIQSAMSQSKKKKQEIKQEIEIVSDLNADIKPVQKNWLTALLFLFGASMIGAGAFFLVEGATYIGNTLGISSEFLGIAILGLGTSLPEFVTAIMSIKRKNVALGYGNIIGANIINLTLLVGGASMFANPTGLPMSKLTLYVSIPLTLLITLIFILPMLIKKKTYRGQGIAMLSIFLLYYIYLIIMTVLKIQV